MTADEIVSLVDADPFEPAERVLARGKGMLVLSAHAGAWELLVAYLAIRLGKPLHTIGRRLYFAPYNDMLLDIRRSAGVETIYQDEGPRGALQVLHEGGALGILADLDMPRLEGVFVDFFGKPAWTSTGPAALARAAGAGMVPVFISWERGRRHRVHVLPEVEVVKTRDRRADTMETTRAWARVIEDFIRRRPEQWVWFHRRWRTRPAPAEPDASRPGRDRQDGNKR
jgi:KDO2-lipid IV(A) lauroyltransferase